MTSLHEHKTTDIDGNTISLSDYAGQVLLIVNVASECGLTPQYTGLQKLQDDYKHKGFSVIGFPCNQFGKQEPGSEAEIKDFCTTHFSVDFPMMSKIDVNGENRDAVYKFLAGDEDITWNFEKFLVGKDGKLIQRFSPKVTPDDPELETTIEAAL